MYSPQRQTGIKVFNHQFISLSYTSFTFRKLSKRYYINTFGKHLFTPHHHSHPLDPPPVTRTCINLKCKVSGILSVNDIYLRKKIDLMISLLKSGVRLQTLFLQKREEFEMYVFGFKAFINKNDTVVILYRHSVLLNCPWFEMGVSNK